MATLNIWNTKPIKIDKYHFDQFTNTKIFSNDESVSITFNFKDFSSHCIRETRDTALETKDELINLIRNIIEIAHSYLEQLIIEQNKANTGNSVEILYAETNTLFNMFFFDWLIENVGYMNPDLEISNLIEQWGNNWNFLSKKYQISVIDFFRGENYNLA